MNESDTDEFAETDRKWALALRAEIERRHLDRRTISEYELGIIVRKILPPDVYADVVEAARESGCDPVEFAGLTFTPFLEPDFLRS